MIDGHGDRSVRHRRRPRAAAFLVVLLAACGSTSPTASGTAAQSAPTSAEPAPSASSSVGPASSTNPTATPLPTPAIDRVSIDFQPLAEGLEAPVGLVASPTVAGRSFILEQAGKILILDGDTVRPKPFLDVSASVVPLTPDYDERGLLGLAFHPDFASNGRLFVYRSVRSKSPGADHTDRLSEFHVDPKTPDRVDPAS